MPEETQLSSPPPSTDPPAPSELDTIRQRLFLLQSLLTEHFDRKSWDEYLRLRRAKQSLTK